MSSLRKDLEDAVASPAQRKVKLNHITSDRVGEHWMDGHLILSSFSKEFVRPWDDFISSTELSKDNLPPFYVRLRTDQAIALQSYVLANLSIIGLNKLHVYWPCDFFRDGALLVGRTDWGSYWVGEKLTKGAQHTPSWIQIPLSRTFTSSSKFMLGEYEATYGSGRPVTTTSNASRQSFPYRKAAFVPGIPDSRRAAPRAAPMNSLK